MNDQYKYGELIAKLMRDKISEQESKQLEEWVCERDENMKLFEILINDYKQKWARQWFRKAGISTRGIKWKRVEGWYRPEHKNVWGFYIVMAVVFLVLAGIYFLLE